MSKSVQKGKTSYLWGLVALFLVQRGQKRREAFHKIESAYFSFHGGSYLPFWRISKQDMDVLLESIIMDDPRRNGKKLRTLRKKLGITQNDFAQVLSVSERSVRRWEKGEVPPVFSLPQIAALCCLLKKADMSIDQLLDDADRFSCP